MTNHSKKMQLRNGKTIGSLVIPSTPSSKTASVCPPAPTKVKTIPATPANSPMIQPMNLTPVFDAIVHFDFLSSKASSTLKETHVFGIPFPIYTNDDGSTPFKPFRSLIKTTKCPCGKVCDLSGGKCCSCSDKRQKGSMKEWRGHGISYNNQTWGYCPKCRTAKTEICMDKVGEGYFH